ncbi:hypothetical protein LX16_2370 [Stackebrandtia albiflava]|uniref:Uncharacterized protein n=1 Tax=Stackebrandtia albiflava TaxID=406432 RepID=A0A562V1E3_9ACTN|nr:hypothetical protein [Stackebrandtia albiflava]TWJ11643.1 hypothetical protein LX16_2370 [Stackebrandtia albiflava]
MSIRRDFDAFADVLANAEPELRHAASAADPASDVSDRLVLAAATRLAARWRTGPVPDADRFLIDSVDFYATRPWHGPSPARTGTARELAETAWAAGGRLARRRLRTAAIVAVLVAVVIAGYLWAVTPPGGAEAAGEPSTPPHTDSHSQMTVLTDTVVALPPPHVVARTPFVHSGLPVDLAVAESSAPPLAESPLDSFAAVLRHHRRWPIVTSPDGTARRVDLTALDVRPEAVLLWPRAVAPDSARFAVSAGTLVLTVDTSGEVTAVPLPGEVGAPVDVGWFPDSRHLQVTTATGTWTVSPDEGTVTPLPWRGDATAFDSATGEAVEFTPVVDGDIATRRWRDGDAEEPRVAPGQPVDAWMGTPFADGTRLVRGCLPSPALELPDGEPADWCVVVLDDTGDREWLLAIGEEYTGVRVLAASHGEIYLQVQASATGDHRVLVWRPADQRLLHVTTMDRDGQLALGDW